MYFCSLKKHSKTYKPRNQSKTFLFSKFQARKRKAEDFASYVTQSFRFLGSKYCGTFAHFCGF